MRDCFVVGCGTDGTNRAILLGGDAAEIEGGTFSDNLRGVIEATRGTLALRGATFANNQYDGSAGVAGGAAVLTNASQASIDDCTFEGNQAPLLYGGAVAAGSGGQMALRDCLFVENGARGGGAVFSLFVPATIERCRFVRNHADPLSGGGGALFSDVPLARGLAMTDCEFEENDAPRGGAVVVNGAASGSRCLFRNNRATLEGGAIYATQFGGSGAIRWEDCALIDNEALRGGAAYVEHGSASFTRSEFRGNRASLGGAIAGQDDGHVSADGCTFVGNSAASNGGAVFAEGGIQIGSSWLHENVAMGDGAALYVAAGVGTGPRRLHGSTLAANEAAGVAGGLFIGDDVAIDVENNILWANSDPSGSGEPAQITVPPTAQAAVNYNCVQNWTGNLGGSGNIGDDPRFVDAPASDYHLAANSPCIDTGDPAYVGPGNERDIDDQRRVWHGRIDMGGDEFGPSAEGDLNCDGTIDAFDIEPFILALLDPAGYALTYPDCDRIIADINRDGGVDAFDIEAFVELLLGG
jgi:predicted outer membrane repeat protein